MCVECVVFVKVCLYCVCVCRTDCVYFVFLVCIVCVVFVKQCVFKLCLDCVLSV